MVVTGPSKSGKTEFVKQLVQNVQWVSPPPDKIVLCYWEWQKVYEYLQDSVTFVKNIPPEDKKLVADLSTPHLLIFEDMMGGKAIQFIVD
jgi:flavin reductase (DIM6/NTAB) family NADH-FMN oxidoreductase RutF